MEIAIKNSAWNLFSINLQDLVAMVNGSRGNVGRVFLGWLNKILVDIVMEEFPLFSISIFRNSCWRQITRQ